MEEAGWRNRIVGYDNVPPEQLRINEMNWRVHPKFQAEALAGALEDVGWVQDIIINKRTGEGWPADRRGIETVVDGHLRIELAVARGEATVPVKYVDLDEREEILILATLDPLAALSQIDPDKLDALLQKVATDQVAVRKLLAKQAEEVGLYRDVSDVLIEGSLERLPTIDLMWNEEPLRVVIMFDGGEGRQDFFDRLGVGFEVDPNKVTYRWQYLKNEILLDEERGYDN